MPSLDYYSNRLWREVAYFNQETGEMDVKKANKTLIVFTAYIESFRLFIADSQNDW